MTARSAPLLAAALLLAACGAPSGGGTGTGGDGDGVSAAVWRLAELDGVPFPATATLRFEPGGRIGGQAPCNGWGGRAEGRPPAFRAVDVVSTLIACAVMDAERAFFAALAAVRRIEGGPDRLLLSGGGRSLVFVPERAT
jgi:heat shock protein HslJ